jgi:hypothetical protein
VVHGARSEAALRRAHPLEHGEDLDEVELVDVGLKQQGLRRPDAPQ